MTELALSPLRSPKKDKAQATTPIEETADKAIDLGFKVDPTKVYIFETIKKSENPRNENLGATCKAHDPLEKRYRDMRYVQTAPSIFEEEMDESFLTLPLLPLVFWRNQITVQGEDIRLMEYMMCHPLYEFSPFRVANKPAFFTLADKDVKDAIEKRKHDTEMKALEAIKETSIDDLKPVARIVFGLTDPSDTAIVNSMNELAKQGKKGTEQKTNAERILENIGNPKLIRTYNIQSAVDRGIISTDMNKMELRMVEGNIFVTKLDTKKPIEEVTNWTFTPEGAKWYTSLKQKI